MKLTQTNLKNYDPKKSAINLNGVHPSKLLPEKIRSGQSFLYRDGGMQSTVIDVRMKENISGKALTKAVNIALMRYPYLTCKFLEKAGDFYLAENPLPFSVEETAKLHSLGSSETNGHLIDITYNKNVIYVSFHHGLCDGRGVMPFVETLLYYYCTYKYNTKFNAPAVRRACDPLLKGETEEPFKSNYFVLADAKSPAKPVEAFSLPEAKEALNKKKTYRYEVTIAHHSLMAFAKENNATPAITIALLMSKAIKKVHPESDKPIVCKLASDVRKGINMDNTFRNCVNTVDLPYTEELVPLSFKEQAGTYREVIKEYKNAQSIKRITNQMISMSDQLDEVHTFEKKKKRLSFYEDLILDSFILSYIGQTKLGECEKYVEAMHLYSSGTNSLSLQMQSSGNYITIDFMQSFETADYIKAFVQTMKEAGLKFSVSDKIEFTTPKDSLQKAHK